jgi:hypothetical protein
MNGNGAVNDTPQITFDTAAKISAANLNLSGLAASYPVVTDSSKNLVSANTAGDYYFGANIASSDTNADTNITLMSSINTKSAQLNVSNSNATSFFTVWSGRVGDTSTALIYSSATDLRIGTATSGQLGTAGFSEKFRFTSAGAFRVVGLTASKPVFTDASKNLVSTGTMPVDQGGTGQTTYTNGQLLIGNTTGNTLTKATLTQGTGVTITNGTGSITLAIGQDVATGASPTFADLTLSGNILGIAGYPAFTARCWVNFNGTGVIALTGSGNVTSLTDNGTGDYTVNFANLLASASFCAVVTGQESAPASPAVNGTAYAAVKRVSTAYASSSIRVQTGNSGGGVDFVAVNVAVFI